MSAALVLVLVLRIAPVAVPAVNDEHSCVDARGRPVAAVEDDELKVVARAAVDPVGGESLVFYNPGLLTWIHPVTRLFFFLHECAHHELGHPLGDGMTPVLEHAADCRAFALLSRRKLGRPEDIQALQKDLYTFGKEEWERVPGPRRSIDPNGCSPT